MLKNLSLSSASRIQTLDGRAVFSFIDIAKKSDLNKNVE